MYPMTPEQIKKHEPMNINNLYEAVPVCDVDKLPDIEVIAINDVNDKLVGYLSFDGNEVVCEDDNTVLPSVAHWLRPVTRESIEAFLREFGEKVWDISEAYNSNIDEDIPDKQTAIIELIKQFTHAAPLGDKQ